MSAKIIAICVSNLGPRQFTSLAEFLDQLRSTEMMQGREVTFVTSPAIRWNLQRIMAAETPLVTSPGAVTAAETEQAIMVEAQRRATATGRAGITLVTRQPTTPSRWRRLQAGITIWYQGAWQPV